MAGTITVGELLSDPTSGNKITIGSGTTLDLVNGAGSVTLPETASGKVLQVVSGVTDHSSWVNTLSSSSVLHAHTFTPLSATSNILIMASIGGEKVVGTSGSISTTGFYYPHIYSGSTAVQSIGNAIFYNAPAQSRVYSSGTRLEASGSTSSRTYSIKAHSVSNSGVTRFDFYDATMTIIEVEA
jgi:hypothetical protein